MKPKFLLLSSSPLSVLVFMRPHLEVLREIFDIKVFVNDTDTNVLKKKDLDLDSYFIPLERKINIFKDINALWVFYWLLKNEKPLVVHTVTPKAGLIGILGSFLARVPIRVHTFTGQVWVTRKGPMRSLLKSFDVLIAKLATDILVDSPSQRDFLVSEGILKCNEGQVLGRGSICGVDTSRFRPDSLNRKRTRCELHEDENSLVFLYLGRLNYDKGILDFVQAFSYLIDIYPKAVLWIIGPDEQNIMDSIAKLYPKVLSSIKRVGYTDQPEKFMQAADVFCLPSYREGFGSSVIEAAACGLPSIVSRIYGLTDAVIEGSTGFFHKPGDVEDIKRFLVQIMINTELIKEMGCAARKYACDVFEQRHLTRAMVLFYQSKLAMQTRHSSDK